MTQIDTTKEETEGAERKHRESWEWRLTPAIQAHGPLRQDLCSNDYINKYESIGYKHALP